MSQPTLSEAIRMNGLAALRQPTLGDIEAYRRQRARILFAAERARIWGA